jgi:KDO2-lipid IV(A) lauroyltransferase
MNPLRRIYKRSHALRRFVRRRRTRDVPWRAGLWLPRSLARARSPIASASIYFALPGRASRSTSGDRLRRHSAAHAAQTHRPRLAAQRGRCFVELAKFDAIERTSTTTCRSRDGALEAVRRSGAAASSSPATSATGNCSAATSRAKAKIAAVARRINDSRLNQLLVDFRARNGMRTILRESPMPARSSILNGAAFALISDQDIKAPSVSVPFFGRLARTPAAAAALAVRRSLPIIPVFAQRRPEGGHRFIALPPIFPPKSADRRRDILELTHEFSRILEDIIRQNPAEWVWWHKRWRRPPVPRLDLDGEIQYPNTVLP